MASNDPGPHKKKDDNYPERCDITRRNLEQFDQESHSLDEDETPMIPADDSQDLAKHEEFLNRVSDIQYMRKCALEAEQPERIGRYKLIRLLGAGGMGQVWLAVQNEPVERTVALKVIHSNLSSPTIIARFESERQTLALMNHSNIARIFDAGTTEQNQPFIVMENVDGSPITKFCDQQQLSVRERLQLFLEVCSGVQHAHQKGVIHRDLKPGNILVGSIDGQANPKIIDFGLAKTTDSRELFDGQCLTNNGQVLGTIQYMSPEQASLVHDNVDTRSDIYSLGVVLYELLTGLTPIGNDRNDTRKPLELLEAVRDFEPPLPSKKVLIKANARSERIAANRKSDPKRLARLIAGDLDCVVMKAIEKRVEQRYSSVSEFAADIRNFLNNEAVLARRPSVKYRFQKFVARNRIAVVAGLSVCLVLVIGLIGTAVGFYNAVIARQEANEARKAEFERANAEKAARQAAQKANERSKRRLVQIEKGHQLLSSVFDDINIYSVRNGDEPLEVALGNRLKHVATQLNNELIGDPVVIAKLQKRLAISLSSLGFEPTAIELFKKAMPVLKKELGNEAPELIECINELAGSLIATGQIDDAIGLLLPTIQLQQKRKSYDELTYSSMRSLATCYELTMRFGDAISVYDQLYEHAREDLGNVHNDVLRYQFLIARSYTVNGQPNKARPFTEKATKALTGKIETSPDEAYEFVWKNMSVINIVHKSNRRREEMYPLFEDTLVYMQNRYGPEHRYTVDCMQKLADVFKGVDTRKSLALQEKAYTAIRNRLGTLHPKTIRSLEKLGKGYREMGEHDEAIRYMSLALNKTDATLGEDSAESVTLTGELGLTYWEKGDLDKAAELLENAFKRREMSSVLPPGYGAFLLDVFVEMGEKEKVRDLSSQLIEYCKESLDPGSRQLAGVLAGVGKALIDVGEFKEAEPVLKESLAFWVNETSAQWKWVADQLKCLLGKAIVEQSRPDEALPVLVEGFNGLSHSKKDTGQSERQLDLLLLSTAEEIVTIYAALGDQESVEQWLQKVKQVEKRIQSIK